MNISVENCFWIDGFWILTATYLPFFSLALCTCAKDADAIGYF